MNYPDLPVLFRSRPATRRRRRLSRGSGLLVGGVSALLIAATAGCGTGASDAGADTSISLKYSSSLGPESPQGELITQWIDAVQEGSDGSIQIESFHSGALLNPTDALAGVGSGRADLAMTSPQYTPSELPLSTFTELPFVTTNSEAFVLAVRDAYESNEALRAEWNEQGVEVLLFVPAGANTLISKSEVDGPEDLNGLEVRAVGRTAGVLEGAGATTSAIPLPEVYESLERGVVQAVSSLGVEVGQDIGATDAAKNVYDPGLGEYTVIPVFVNKQWWDRQSDEVREAFTSAADEYYASLGENLTEIQDETCIELEDADLNLQVWSDGDKDQLFQDAGQVTWDEWTSERTSEAFDARAFLDEHVERVKGYEEQSTFEPTVEQCA